MCEISSALHMHTHTCIYTCAPLFFSLACIIDEIQIKGKIHYSWGRGWVRAVGSKMQISYGGMEESSRQEKIHMSKCVSGWAGKWAGWT
jgi:hypothetical protein